VEYITLPGWQTSIEGVRDYENLPQNAKKYVEMIEEYVQVPGTYVYCPSARLLFLKRCGTVCEM
jgi:adenylosuccinate synthase